MENSADDSLTYTPYETYFFNKERSGPLSQDDYVTILHPLVVGLVNYAVQEQPSLLKLVHKAINSVFKPDSVYVSVKVRDILFDGMVINCTVTDFAGKAACSQVKNQEGILEREKNIFLFSVFGPRNGTVPKRVTVRRGTRNSRQTEEVIAVDGLDNLNTWGDKECNLFRGTDGWIYHPFLNRDEGLDAVAYDLCRSVHAYWVEDRSIQGVPTQVYHGDLGETKCYCSSPRRCPPSGLMDMTKCLKVPILASLPHFLNADPALLRQVDGLDPHLEKHIVRLELQPMLAVPLDVWKRGQINMKLQPVETIEFMQTVPEVVHPLFWIEEGVVLDGPVFAKVKSFFVALKVLGVVKYLLLVASICGLGIGGYYHSVHHRLKQAQTLPEKISSGSGRFGRTVEIGLENREKSNWNAWENEGQRNFVNDGITAVD